MLPRDAAPQSLMATGMLQLPVFRSLGKCVHLAEMLVGLPLCFQTSRLIQKTSKTGAGWQSLCASLLLSPGWLPYAHSVWRRAGAWGQRTKSQQAIRRHPHCPQEPGILPGCPLFASAFPVRLHCALASREGVFGVHTAHTVHRRPPHLGNRTGYFASFTCTVIVYIT